MEGHEDKTATVVESHVEAKRLTQRASRLMANWQDESEIRCALELANQAIALDPSNRQAWVVIGEALIEVEDFAGAAHALEHARALGAGSARFWLATGLAHTELPGHERQAQEAFHQLITLNPQDDYALHHLAEALAKAGWDGRPKLLTQSAELLRRAVELSPEDAHHRRRLAAVLYRLGEYENALAVYEELIAHWPSAQSTWQAATHRKQFYGRSAALGELGRTEEAHTVLDGVDIPCHESVWLVYKAELLNRLGRFNEALAVLESCVPPPHQDRDGRRWRVRAAALRGLGRSAEAEETERIARTKPMTVHLVDVLYR